MGARDFRVFHLRYEKLGVDEIVVNLFVYPSFNRVIRTCNIPGTRYVLLVLLLCSQAPVPGSTYTYVFE